MNKKLKFKKGDYVRIDPPMLGQIIRVNKKIGYTIKVFASVPIEIAYYDDNDVYKISKEDEWVKTTLDYENQLNQTLTK